MRPAELQGHPNPAGINSSFLPENPVSDLSANVSVLAFLASRGNNLRLTSTENIIDPPAPELQPYPVTGGAILHVKPAVDTALPPQNSPQDTTQYSTNVLNLGSEHQQPQLTSIENPPAPETQQGPVITGGVIVQVKPAVDTTLLPLNTPQCSTKVLNLGTEHQQPQLTSIEDPPNSRTTTGTCY